MMDDVDMAYPSIDPNSAVTVVTLRISTHVVAQYDAIAAAATEATGRLVTRSDVIRLVLTPASGETVREKHGGSVSASLRDTASAIATAFDSPPSAVPPSRASPAPSEDSVRARLEARVRAAVSGLRATQRVAISKLSTSFGRPRHDVLLAVLRDLETAGELKLLPPRTFDRIKHSQRMAGLRDPARGDLLFVTQVTSKVSNGKTKGGKAGKPRFVGKPTRTRKSKPPEHPSET